MSRGRSDAMSSFSIKGVVRGGRVEFDRPIDLPDGTPVVVTTDMSVADDDGPMSPEEIARALAAMQKQERWEIPDDLAADLDAWERKINNQC
jgi:hypothetical protein